VVSRPREQDWRTRNAISACATRPGAVWNRMPRRVKWFIKAARQGNKRRSKNLGLHYASTERGRSPIEIAKNTRVNIRRDEFHESQKQF